MQNPEGWELDIPTTERQRSKRQVGKVKKINAHPCICDECDFRKAFWGWGWGGGGVGVKWRWGWSGGGGEEASDSSIFTHSNKGECADFHTP